VEIFFHSKINFKNNYKLKIFKALQTKSIF